MSFRLLFPQSKTANFMTTGISRRGVQSVCIWTGLTCAYLLSGRLAVPRLKVGAINPVLFVMIHIGKEIREEMLRQERTPAWLARKINCERPNVYYIFSQPHINTGLLVRISAALNRDFFALYSAEFQGKESVK